MDWIGGYPQARLNVNDKSLAHNFKQLSISQSNDNKKESSSAQDSIKGFDLFSLKSTLQKQFREQHYCQNISQDNQTQPSSQHDDQSEISKQTLISFVLMQTTPYQTLNVFVTVELNLKLEYIKFISIPTRNLQLLSFSLEQINTLSRLISLNLNSKLHIGCLSIDPDSGCLSYQIVNNSLGHLRRRIVKAPNQLVKSIQYEITDIQKTWRFVLPIVLNILGQNQKRNLKHPFWKNYKQKIDLHSSQDFLLLSNYIKQSYIEHPFQYEEQVKNQQNMLIGTRAIRSVFVLRDQKYKKKRDFDFSMNNFNFNESKLTNGLAQFLSIFVNKDKIKFQTQKKKFQLKQDKKQQLVKQLIVTNFESKTKLYSKLRIDEIKKQSNLTTSGFSQLKLLHLIGQKCQDKAPTLNYIVTKATQQIRYFNETQILKQIGEGKSLFITRYYFSQNAENKNKILLEYCPQKSIDSYLHTHKKFISIQTKLFFLYQISIGLRFLRDFRVVHNDLKPQNVLLKIVSDKLKINGTFLLRLIDFGQSYNYDINKKYPYKRGYTIPYACPEQIKSIKFTQKNDVFSFGVMLFQIIFDCFPADLLRKGKQAYNGEDDYLKFYSIAAERCNYFSFPKIMQLLFQLCLKCLNPQAGARPTIDWICIIMKETLTFLQKQYIC